MVLISAVAVGCCFTAMKGEVCANEPSWFYPVIPFYDMESAQAAVQPERYPQTELLETYMGDEILVGYSAKGYVLDGWRISWVRWWYWGIWCVGKPSERYSPRSKRFSQCVFVLEKQSKEGKTSLPQRSIGALHVLKTPLDWCWNRALMEML